MCHKMLYVTCHYLDNATTCAKEGETLRYNWPNKASDFGQGLRFKVKDSLGRMEHDWQIKSVTASAQHKMPAIRGSDRLLEWSGGHAIAINWSPCLCMRTWTDNEFSLARLAKILTWRFQRWVVSLESNQQDLQPWCRLQKQFGGGTHRFNTHMEALAALATERCQTSIQASPSMPSDLSPPSPMPPWCHPWGKKALKPMLS